MFFEHIYDKSLAQGSYLVGCQVTGEAIVIDAKRDIDTYLKIAEYNKLKITHITETHIHADFLSGSRELAAATGADLYLSDEGGEDWQYEFPHIGLREDDELIGVRLESEEFDSIGGYIIGHLRRLPEENEVIEVDHIKFCIESLDKNRIKKVRIFT